MHKKVGNAQSSDAGVLSCSMKDLDLKLRQCRSPLLDPASRLSREAKEAKKRSKADRRAAKDSSGGYPTATSDAGQTLSQGPTGSIGTSTGSQEQRPSKKSRDTE